MIRRLPEHITDDKFASRRAASVICHLSFVICHADELQASPLLVCYSVSLSGIMVAVNGLRLEHSSFIWNHEEHGSFIRGECADVSLLFDSCSRRWTLRIYKRQTTFGHPVTYEIAFKERYGPTVEQAIALANNILLVELQ
jgi:hypothetical protein